MTNQRVVHGADPAPSGAPGPAVGGRSPSRGRRPWGWLVGLAAGLALAACSGGTVDVNAGSDPSAKVGVLQVSVRDAYGTAVGGAAVQGTLGGVSVTGLTDAEGVAQMPVTWPDGTADLLVSRTTFIDSVGTAAIVAGQVNSVAVTLERASSPAGGSLTTRSGVLPVSTNDAQQLQFEIELVIVGADARPVENLGPGQFALRGCVPDAASDANDCLRGRGQADAGYTPVTPAPEALTVIPGGPARPYAAGLLLDQSGSIAQTDPTGARLFSAKAFLSGLDDDALALLAAFAADPGGIIAERPMTLYPPFRDQAAAPALFPELDALGPLVGGNTPLYTSIDTLRERIVNDPTLPAGIAKAVAVFTDGEDNTCDSADTCRAARQQTIAAANAAQLRLFTIGLSDRLDIEALGELANQTGGAMLYAESAEQLLPLYGSLGRLLSLSLPTYRLRWTVRATTPDAFPPGAALLGRVQVTAEGQTFDVPFVIGIPSAPAAPSAP